MSIKQTIGGMDCTYSIACKKKADDGVVTCCPKFDPLGNGEKLWKDLKENGKLTEKCVDENLKSIKEKLLEYKRNYSNTL